MCIREYQLSELGYFTEPECEAIRAKCEGTYMNIHVSWCNYKGNCTLFISSDYGTEDMAFEESEQAVKNLFLHRALSSLTRR